jgi:uncharacterized cupredoxin-like copper-binding protein
MEMKRLLVASVCALFASAVCAQHGAHHSTVDKTPFGRAAASSQAKRTVRVEMSDQMRFRPAAVP